MIRPLPLALFLGITVGTAPSGGQAQTTGGLEEVSAQAEIREADELHARHRPREALALLQRVLASDSANHGALWRAAREAVTLAMLTGDEEARGTWYDEAEAFARRAVEIDPEALEGHYWRSVARVRRAEDEGARTLIGLAQAIRDDALLVLERDSLHAGAHGVMGGWHAQVLRLSGITRFLARRLFGADALEHASWEAAETHLRRAVELEPEVLSHRLSLARVLLDRGLEEEAREQLRKVLERPALDPIDPVLKQKAQELLRRL